MTILTAISRKCIRTRFCYTIYIKCIVSTIKPIK
uniref:Uncharacterized protein n=1 Tax=Myoviridae sp. ct0jJ30 TaxID=2825014 RepID=A0A8S5PHG1_9CAUD|nr:MAG TPA: hypothetical protein [Myoviridae sp. ct0jJ30]